MGLTIIVARVQEIEDRHQKVVSNAIWLQMLAATVLVPNRSRRTPADSSTQPAGEELRRDFSVPAMSVFFQVYSEVEP